MYVYADVVLLVNVVMNVIILVLTAWATSICYKVWRVFFAAVLGAVYALGGAFPEFAALYSPLAKVGASLVIVITAFGWGKFLVRLVASFYIVSMLFGGAVIGWLYFAGLDGLLAPGSESLVSLSWIHLMIGAGVALLLAMICFRRMASNIARRNMLYPITIGFCGRQIRLMSMLDTGNQLFSATGRRPVVLVEYDSLKRLLSSQVNRYLSSNESGEWLSKLCECEDPGWLARVQPIAFRSVGGANMMIGFRPDRLSVAAPDAIIETDAVVIGIFAGRLSADGSYSALLHPAVIQFANIDEGANVCA